MSSRRNGNGNSSTSLTRAEQIATGRLRMDRNPTHTRITDPSLAIGRRKEIDNVMKRARAASPGSFDRKLLEVEEKDPNRWRHTGYKQMYLDSRGSSAGSASPPSRRSRSRSPRIRRSPPPLVSTTTPHHRLSRERERRENAVVSSTQRARPESSTQPIVSSSRDRERERERERERDREREKERERERERERTNRPPLPRTRPPSPPPRKGGRSPSGSSVSSCSDESCSVCSVKKHGRQRSRSRSFSVPRSSSSRLVPPTSTTTRPPPSQPHKKLTKPLNSGNANAGPSTLSLRRTASSINTSSHINVATTKKSKPPPGVSVPSSSRLGSSSSRDALADAAAAKKRSRDEKVLEWQRTQLDPHKLRKPEKSHPSTPPSPSQSKDRNLHKLKTRIKKEDERPKKKSSGEKKNRRDSVTGEISPEVIQAALAAESSGEDDSTTDDDSTHHHNENRLTLSERFGKMAQWSADRSNAMQNMRITRGAAVDGGGLTVRIEEMDPLPGEQIGDPYDLSPPHRFAHSPAPEGHYPDELLSSAPSGLPSWDDVRVRYDYYKKRGYLRGLTLSDYIKWEEWWYRYQQWLKQERNYERWTRGSGGGGSGGGGGGGGHRRRRGNSSQHATN